MAKPWEQAKDEPDLWYGRFHSCYLMLGRERTIDGAYAKHRQDGGKPVDKPSHRRAAPAWSAAAVKYRWAERARAYDNDERRRLREARLEQSIKVQALHENMFSHAFVKAANRVRATDPADMTFAQAVSLMTQIASMERTIRMAPITGRDEPGRDDDASPESATFVADTDARSPLSNADLAEVTAILIQHGAIHAEPEPDGQPGDNPADRPDAGAPASQPEVLPGVAPDAQAEGVPGP